MKYQLLQVTGLALEYCLLLLGSFLGIDALIPKEKPVGAFGPFMEISLGAILIVLGVLGLKLTRRYSKQ